MNQPSEPASIYGAPDVHARRSKNRRSVSQRWQAAVNELVAMQSECDERLQNLPESLQESAAAEALRSRYISVVTRPSVQRLAARAESFVPHRQAVEQIPGLAPGSAGRDRRSA
jgi:hypothetical protein